MALPATGVGAGQEAPEPPRLLAGTVDPAVDRLRADRPQAGLDPEPQPPGDLLRRGAVPYAAAWYRKNAFTFTDAIAAVRHRIWMGDISDNSASDRDMRKIPPDRIIRMTQALCFAA